MFFSIHRKISSLSEEKGKEDILQMLIMMDLSNKSSSVSNLTTFGQHY